MQWTAEWLKKNLERLAANRWMVVGINQTTGGEQLKFCIEKQHWESSLEQIKRAQQHVSRDILYQVNSASLFNELEHKVWEVWRQVYIRWCLFGGRETSFLTSWPCFREFIARFKRCQYVQQQACLHQSANKCHALQYTNLQIFSRKLKSVSLADIFSPKDNNYRIIPV